MPAYWPRRRTRERTSLSRGSYSVSRSARAATPGGFQRVYAAASGRSDAAPAQRSRLRVVALAFECGFVRRKRFASGVPRKNRAAIWSGPQSARPWLRVISHPSVIRYQSAAKPRREMVRELKVDAFIEGSVMRTGNRLRLSGRMVHSSTLRQLWAQSYERDVSDIPTWRREAARGRLQRPSERNRPGA